MKFEEYVKKNFRKDAEKICGSPAATGKTAGEFAAELKRADVIGLCGELGTGKTAFISGAVKRLGVKKKEAASPTFGYVREYEGKKIIIYHFDFYGIKGRELLEKIGYRDHYLSCPESVVFIEWADLIKETWKDFTHVVLISHAGGNKRIIRIYRR